MDEILLEINEYYASSESLYDGIIEDACNKGLTINWRRKPTTLVVGSTSDVNTYLAIYH